MSDKISAIVVDDDKDTVAVFRDYLKLKNVDVVGTGYDGKQGVELFKKFKPDVVFLDHRMPEYNGLFALYNIRQIDPDAIVIIITADNTLDMNPKIHELNPSRIIHKPFNINEVMAVVEEIMQGAVTNSVEEKEHV